MAPAEHTTLKEGPYQAALADIAVSENQHFKDFTLPLVKQGIDLAEGSGSKSMIDRAGATASDAVLADAMPQVKGGLRQLSLGGAGTGGGASVMGDALARSAVAGGAGRAGFGARFGQRSAQLAGIEGGLALARGQQAEGQAGLGQIAGQQQQLGEQSIQADMASSAALGQGLGTAAGLGLSYGMMRRA